MFSSRRSMRVAALSKSDPGFLVVGLDPSRAESQFEAAAGQ